MKKREARDNLRGARYKYERKVWRAQYPIDPINPARAPQSSRTPHRGPGVRGNRPRKPPERREISGNSVPLSFCCSKIIWAPIICADRHHDGLLDRCFGAAVTLFCVRGMILVPPLTMCSRGGDYNLIIMVYEKDI